jgi:hypothetical protein
MAEQKNSNEQARQNASQANEQAQQNWDQMQAQAQQWQNRMQDQARQAQEQFRNQYNVAADITARSFKTWNDMVAASTDMAFDTVIRNWNYAKTVRDEADKAVEATITQQRQFAKEMANAFQGFQNNAQQMMDQAVRNTTTPTR